MGRASSGATRAGGVVAAVALLVVGGAKAADREGWDQPTETRRDTPEAELIVRVGDIDNLGYGWPPGFDPFTGAETPPHRFPWDPDLDDPAGTDRIMVVSGYRYPVRAGVDGYTSDTRRPANKVQPIALSFEPGRTEIQGALLQLFVDDFQAARFGTRFRVTWDGQPAEFLDRALAPLDQHGPIGKLLTIQVPDAFLPTLADGELELRIDDPATGTGDGYAIDFVRLLINPRDLAHVGSVAGEVTDALSGLLLADVTLSAAGIAEATTDDQGRFALADVPAGLAVVTASAPGYLPSTRTVDLRAGDLSKLSFDLQPDPAGVPPTATPEPPEAPTPAELAPVPEPEEPAAPPGPPPRPLLEVLGELPWAWIAPGTLTGLALLIWLVAGFLRPRAFDPGATVCVAGSSRGLGRAEDRRLVELPGGKPGFWRHARVALAADGAAVRRPRSARIVLRAGPRGATVFTRAAGLEAFDRRTRRWQALPEADLRAGYVPGKSYRCGDLYLRFS